MPYSPPYHPDPKQQRIVQIEPDKAAVEQIPPPPVWVRLEVEGQGVQRVVGFAMAASPDAVYVQVQYLGRTHHVWVKRRQVTRRVIRRG